MGTDYNSTRSNTTSIKKGDGDPTKSGAVGHNTTRSNRANIHGGGGGGSTQGLGSTLGVIKSGISLVSVIVLIAASACLLYTSPSPRDATLSRMPSSA